MSLFIESFLLLQLFLSCAGLLLWILKKLPFELKSSELLKLSYSLILISLFIPSGKFFLSISSTQNPFGVTQKLDSPLKKQKTTPSVLPLNRSFEKGSFQNSPLKHYFFLKHLFSILFCLSILLGILFFRDLFRLKRLREKAYLYKEIGSIKIWLHESISCPFSYRFKAAEIFLPEDSLMNPQFFKSSLLHELQHHRQKDTLWIHLMEFLKVFFIFNPLVKMLIQEIKEIQEWACDESLLKQKKLSLHQYSSCLVQAAENRLLQQSAPIGALGMIFEKKPLKRRIEKMFLIKENQKNPNLKLLSYPLYALFFFLAYLSHGSLEAKSISLQEAQSLAQKINTKQKIQVYINQDVMKWLNRSLNKKHELRRSFKRMKKYEKMIQGKLAQAGLPPELIAVALMESGFKKDSVSSAKAAGLWQFMPQTARNCDLKVNKKLDERFIPERITDAAVCYYQKLYAIFQNWPVVLSAYNTGERRMMKAIAKARHNDAARLSFEGKLGKEAKNYLPKVMAAMILVQNPKLLL